MGWSLDASGPILVFIDRVQCPINLRLGNGCGKVSLIVEVTYKQNIVRFKIIDDYELK
jgi:hypothetical protein